MVQYQVRVIYKKTKKGLNYILKRYYKYGKRLQLLKGKKLLQSIVQNYKIELEPGISLRFFLTYKLIETKLQALKKFI